MKKSKVRIATEVDLKFWLRMRNSLWSDSLTNNKKDIEEYFSGQSTIICQCFVIEKSKVPIGFIELNIRNYVEGSLNTRVPYIEGWYIDKEFRGQGFGKLLIEQAEIWAKENGFMELASDSDIENITSISTHKKLGFKETDRIVCFLKQLN